MRSDSTGYENTRTKLNLEVTISLEKNYIGEKNSISLYSSAHT